MAILNHDNKIIKIVDVKKLAFILGYHYGVSTTTLLSNKADRLQLPLFPQMRNLRFFFLFWSVKTNPYNAGNTARFFESRTKTF